MAEATGHAVDAEDTRAPSRLRQPSWMQGVEKVGEAAERRRQGELALQRRAQADAAAQAAAQAEFRAAAVEMFADLPEALRYAGVPPDRTDAECCAEAAAPWLARRLTYDEAGNLCAIVFRGSGNPCAPGEWLNIPISSILRNHVEEMVKRAEDAIAKAAQTAPG